MAIRASIFEFVGRIAVRLPRFRGRTRVVLALFNAMGLRNEHVFLETRLTEPLPYRALLDMHSWLQRIAFLTGEYEADTTRFLLDLHQRQGQRGYILDVGSNVGLISVPTALMLAKRGAVERPVVVSVEAVPDNVAALTRNIRLNGASDLIHVLNAALGERAGTVDIQVEGDLASGQGTGTANILPQGLTTDPNGTYQCVRIPIEVKTLDALYLSGELSASCRVMKIDTDGYDLKVLQGGREFLLAARPIIFGEFSAHCMAWHKQTLEDVGAFAMSVDYSVWQRTKDVATHRFRREVEMGTYSQDLLLVPRELEGSVSDYLA